MTSAEYQYKEGGYKLTEQMKRDFNENGFIMVRNFLDDEELTNIKKAIEDNSTILSNAFGVADDTGKDAQLSLWNHPGNDVTGMVARCEKIVNTCEHLLGGEVYHYHTKLMMKAAKKGGKHVWHQDYGYWYLNGCLFPDMMTVFIAIDKCHKENACLQILRGSHKCGRIEHLMVGGQTGADLTRVDQISKVCELQYVEMEPGDALFFHCNLIHCSGQNLSNDRRWAFLCAYNKATNNPVKKHHHPCYTPLVKVPNSSIKECREYTNMAGKDFMDPFKAETIIATKHDEDDDTTTKG